MILLLPDNGAATNHDYHFGGRYTNAKYSLLQWFPAHPFGSLQQKAASIHPHGQHSRGIL
jgi:hypothetical protein